MDNTFLMLISLLVSLSNQVQALQQENAVLKTEFSDPRVRPAGQEDAVI